MSDLFIACVTSAASHYISALAYHGITPSAMGFAVDSLCYAVTLIPMCLVSGSFVQIAAHDLSAPYENSCGDLHMNSSNMQCDFSGHDNTLAFM